MIADFTPPQLEFTFEKEMRAVLYSAPTVTLVVGFSVGVTIEYGIVLDSKGIRQAVEEDNPLKALNSFALKDKFDGVDKVSTSKFPTRLECVGISFLSGK